MAWHDTQSFQKVLDDKGYPTPKRVAITSNYTMDGTEDIVAFNSVGAGTPAYTITLPLAASVPAGKHITVINEDGTCGAANTVSLTRQGADNAEGGVGYTLNTAYTYGTLSTDGVSTWFQVYGPFGFV